MVDKNTPGWKIKKCGNCGQKYIKGKGVTKIWLPNESRYKNYPDDKDAKSKKN